MAHEHNIYDADNRFSINPTTRAVTNITAKTKLIQYDHNSELFTFELPRYVEGHDMSLCNRVEIHYLNIGTGGERNEDVYEVNDWQISPDDNSVVICSWLISANATQLAGSLNFLLRFACIAEDGTIDYAWHTEIYSGISVSNGMNNSESVIAEFPDVLEAWKQEIFAETVDQTYKPYSENPQSGKAVKQALESLPTIPKVIHVMSEGTYYDPNELPDALEWFESHPLNGGRYDAMTPMCISEPILFVDDNGGWTFYVVHYTYAEIDIDNIDESATWVELKFAKADDVPKVDSQYGISMDYNKNLKIAPASNSVIMESTEQYKPITPKYLGYGVGCHGIARLSTMPTAASKYLGWIVLYTGETNETYTKNSLYECINDGGYKWVEYIPAPIGDIETALDSIIAIQNSLIGGESV